MYEGHSIVKEFTILVSDKNRNIREYLRREMASEGYQVRVAKNACEVLDCIYHCEPVDLVILDPELPDADKIRLIEKINNRLPTLPVIFHSFSRDDVKHIDVWGPVNYVEKEGKSIEHLKTAISELLIYSGETSPSNHKM